MQPPPSMKFNRKDELMRLQYLLVIILIFAVLATGCSNKKLIAQKDSEIAAMQQEIDELQGQVRSQEQLNEELERALANLREKEQIWIEEKKDLTHITLDGSVTFPTASAELTADGRDIIEAIWRVLENYPDREILIEGHTDSRQIAPSYRHKYKSNWELSSARAHTILHFVLDKFGGNPEKTGAVGYGEHRPLADNTTSEGRAVNRRVVITVGSKAAMQKEASKDPF
jgi:chemotaxis protein MotB